uniref:ubiquitinyl hydrolase 1 n=1 Tax=Meloidogyne javanica TaxID=6303 RepID=A0A915MQY5_MELJA
MVACKIKLEGQSYLVPDDLVIESDKKLDDFTILEIPGEINDELLRNNYIIAIVRFVSGGVPNAKMLLEPYIAVLNADLNYDSLRLELIEKGSFLLQKPYYKMRTNFKIVLQNSDGSNCYYFDTSMKKPLFNECVNKGKKVIQIIVEWDLSLMQEFQNSSFKEQIYENYSLLNKFIESKETPISLLKMIDDFVKPGDFNYLLSAEPIQFWNCPKCKKPSGSMQIKFDHLPDILVVYLKRFNFLTGSHKKKNDTNVYALEELDMSSYIDNQHSLEDLSKDKVETNANKYDLSCIIYHHGCTFSSGHYTAATRNFLDGKWRLFNDTEVSDKSQNEICTSDCSYMLFYQRKRSIPWFPHAVPYHIIQKYHGDMYV